MYNNICMNHNNVLHSFHEIVTPCALIKAVSNVHLENVYLLNPVAVYFTNEPVAFNCIDFFSKLCNILERNSIQFKALQKQMKEVKYSKLQVFKYL